MSESFIFIKFKTSQAKMNFCSQSNGHSFPLKTSKARHCWTLEFPTVSPKYFVSIFVPFAHQVEALRGHLDGPKPLVHTQPGPSGSKYCCKLNFKSRNEFFTMSIESVVSFQDVTGNLSETFTRLRKFLQGNQFHFSFEALVGGLEERPLNTQLVS